MKFRTAAMATVLLALVGCQEEVTGPSTSDFDKEREALMARLQKKKSSNEPAAQAAKPAAEPSGPGFGAVDQTFAYDRTGKRDPFRSFHWERPDRVADEERRTPLERFDVAQLSLVAVVWNTGNARALIQDPAGASYIIAEGARIGKNDGRVIDIGDNAVVVKETYKDFLGQETTKDIEMRIRGNQGG